MKRKWPHLAKKILKVGIQQFIASISIFDTDTSKLSSFDICRADIW